MNPTISRIALGIGLLVVAVALLLVLKGGDDDGGESTVSEPAKETGALTMKPKPKPKPRIQTVVVRGGEPVGGVKDLTFEAGETIRFDVRSDEDEEVHVHGYDIEELVGPGNDARFNFPGEIEGLFEVELHGTGTLIAELRVEP